MAAEPAHQRVLEWTDRAVDGRTYRRVAVPTRWLDESDDLEQALHAYLPPLTPADTVVISEKVAILLTGRAIPAAPPGRVARLMAQFVRPPAESYGLSVPEKMQFVVQSVGAWRVLAAGALSAMTRPFGVRGVFYQVAGPIARDVDGALPPYDHLLFPPLPQHDAEDLCVQLEKELGVGVCIADLNDFGGRIRAASPLAPPISVLTRVLADNPLGQRLTGTPFGVVRPVSAAA
jgi:F420-0:gamma-glutamyl ligase